MFRASCVFGRLIVLAFVLLFFERPASADTVPLQINFQGHLRDTAGFLLSGSRDVTFRIYSAPTGGAPLWSEVQAGVPVQGGLFSVLLGSVTPIPSSTFDGSTRHLGVEIAGDTGEMSPRVPLVSVPYAYHSHEADTATLAALADRALRADSSLNASLLGNQVPSFYLNSANFSGSAWATLIGGGNADALHSHAVSLPGRLGGGTLDAFFMSPTSGGGFATRLGSGSLVGKRIVVYASGSSSSLGGAGVALLTMSTSTDFQTVRLIDGGRVLIRLDPDSNFSNYIVQPFGAIAVLFFLLD